MIPLRIVGETNRLGAPQTWDEAQQGKCGALSVRIEGDSCYSAWEPTPAELACLNEGGRVILRCYGGQIPVMLSVEPSP